MARQARPIGHGRSHLYRGRHARYTYYTCEPNGVSPGKPRHAHTRGTSQTPPTLRSSRRHRNVMSSNLRDHPPSYLGASTVSAPCRAPSKNLPSIYSNSLHQAASHCISRGRDHHKAIHIRTLSPSPVRWSTAHAHSRYGNVQGPLHRFPNPADMRLVRHGDLHMGIRSEPLAALRHAHVEGIGCRYFVGWKSHPDGAITSPRKLTARFSSSLPTGSWASSDGADVALTWRRTKPAELWAAMCSTERRCHQVPSVGIASRFVYAAAGS